MPKNPKTIRQLVKIADRWFSQLTRLEAATDNGYCTCVTCGAIKFWKEIDAGHGITRDRYGTRYEPSNVHPQCISCNRFKSGRGVEYANYIIDTYGKREFNRLVKLSHQKIKLSVEELEEIIELSKQGVKVLKKVKGL